MSTPEVSRLWDEVLVDLEIIFPHDKNLIYDWLYNQQYISFNNMSARDYGIRSPEHLRKVRDQVRVMASFMKEAPKNVG